KKAGGLLVNQYEFNWPPFCDGGELAKGSYESGIAKIKQWLPHDLEKASAYIKEHAVHPENAGGFSALIEVEELDGTLHKYLLDTGWSYEWMDAAFKREGIDKMLLNREIEALFISHEHFDHFWGLPVTLKYDPTITLYIPQGFYKEGLQYIKDCGHTGKVVTVPNGLNPHIPGMATFVFDIPIICRVYGEQSMYFNVADKGLVSVTGCCHQGIIQFAETAYKEIKYENDNFHGIYGGLHISPFDDWDPKYDDLVISLRNYDFDRIGCNHCTGILCANKFIKQGYPVIEGTARFRSKDKAYLGNGDVITFG
ncbi:MAG: MBL fold metallo-hydrolase, partial [Desulfuromusa sp.]|nr:MBL fold metallo-hydrolase [Desulfuromusa sp.]